MSKQVIIKWSKRIGSIIGIGFIALSLYVFTYWLYQDVYIPSKLNSLCEKAYANISEADKIALEIMKDDEFVFYNRIETAITILTKSAEEGNIKSAVLLGRYYKGYDIEKGFNSSTCLGNRASYQCLYDTEKGFNSSSESNYKDFEKSSYWYLQAAIKGNAEAQGELGHNYKYGIGVKQNFDKAIYWTKLGADNGYSVAQWRMGYLYLNGLAIYTIGFTDYWYNGNGEFISLDKERYRVKDSYLSTILNNPIKVYLKPDIKKAKYYWKLAANQGLKEARDALEKIYEY